MRRSARTCVLPVPHVPDGLTIAPIRQDQQKHQGTEAIMPDNGMVERFNGRVGSEVLGITLHSHAGLEPLLRGFNAAYNARRQRVLDGKTPDEVVAERLKARRKLARGKPEGRAGPEDISKARLIAEAAKEVSRPDS